VHLYKNSAGRMLEVFSRLTPPEGQSSAKFGRLEFANGLGVVDSWTAIFTAIADLNLEFETFTEDILQIAHNSPKYQLFRSSLPVIQGVLHSIKIDVPANSAQVSVPKEATFALTFIADALPQEDAPDENDLRRIRELVNELQGEIESSTEFAQSVREWLLDLVRIIRDSLDRFAIRGSRGMRQQFSTLLGELMQNYDTAQKVKEKKPGVWQKFTSAVDLMVKITALAEKWKPAITFAQKLLPMITGQVLPAPGEEQVKLDSDS
jgi:hypothetical protein